jgi:spore germination protein GerM
MTRRRPVTIVLGAVLALGGCAISAEDRATAVPDQDVPFGLLDPGATAPAGSQPAVDVARIDVYLVARDSRRLVPVPREAVGDRSLATVIRTLAEGPTPAEADTGLGTALPSGEVITRVGAAGGTATVDLGAAFEQLTGRNQLVAIAQIVATATGQPGIGRVAFTVEGTPILVPRGDGTLTGNPVSRDAYPLLIGTT